MLNRGSAGQWSIAVRSTRKSNPIAGSSRSQVRRATTAERSTVTRHCPAFCVTSRTAPATRARIAATAAGSAFTVSAVTWRSALRARADEPPRVRAPERAVLADPLLQLHEGVEQHLGPRRAAGDVVVHGH